MKTLSMLLLILLSTCVYSQPVERGYQPYFHSESTVFLKSENNYFVGYSLHDPFQGFLTGTELAMLDSTGEVVWNLPVFDLGWENYRINDASMTIDSNIVIAGFIHMCDVSQGYTALEKVSRNGVQQWYKEYEYGINHQVLGLSNGNILCTIGASLYFLDANGDSVKAIAFAEDVTALHETPNDLLLIGTTSMFYRCDISGNLLDSLSLQTTGFAEMDSNKFIVTGGDSIMLFDSTLTLISSWSPPAGYQQLRNVKFDGTVILAIATNSSVDYLVKISDDLTTSQFYSFPYNNYEITDVVCDDSSYVLSGNQERHDNRSFYIKQFDTLFASINYASDAGITDIFLDSLTIDTTDWQFSPCHISFKASVTIKNYGTSVLNTVNANIVFPQMVAFCYPYGEVKRLNSLAIAPGDTKTVFLGNFSETNFFNAAVNIYNVCFWSSVPDDYMDVNLDNDKLCKDFTATIAGINEKNAVTPFTIYPNPSNSLLTIERRDATSAIMNIYTISGKRLESFTLNEKTEVISVSHLPPSVYFLEIVSGERLSRKLFIRN